MECTERNLITRVWTFYLLYSDHTCFDYLSRETQLWWSNWKAFWPSIVVARTPYNLWLFSTTVKPVLRGHRIKRTPSIKRTVAEVSKFISLIYFKWNLYKADTSIKRTRTLKKYLKWSFLLLTTCIKRTLVIKFHHPTCQTPEMRKIASNCHPQIFRFLH